MYQMLKNAFTYSLIQYWNREHAIYLYFQGPYDVCRTHWILYSNLYLWNFCKHEVRSFRMIISIFYCLKFFTFKCSSFCSVKRWKERKEWRNTFANACPPYTSPWFSCSVMMWTRSPLPQVDRYKQVRNTPVLASVFK